MHWGEGGKVEGEGRGTDLGRASSSTTVRFLMTTMGFCAVEVSLRLLGERDWVFARVVLRHVCGVAVWKRLKLAMM